MAFSFNYLAGIYLLKVSNRNTRTRCQINSKLTTKTRERDFIINFKHISHLFLMLLLLVLNKLLPAEDFCKKKFHDSWFARS